MCMCFADYSFHLLLFRSREMVHEIVIDNNIGAKLITLPTVSIYEIRRVNHDFRRIRIERHEGIKNRLVYNLFIVA
jgi:hypothetical protein